MLYNMHGCCAVCSTGIRVKFSHKVSPQYCCAAPLATPSATQANRKGAETGYASSRVGHCTWPPRRGSRGARGPWPPSPQKIAPPNSQARIQGGQEGLGPPLQNPGSAYAPPPSSPEASFFQGGGRPRWNLDRHGPSFCSNKRPIPRLGAGFINEGDD